MTSMQSFQSVLSQGKWYDNPDSSHKQAIYHIQLISNLVVCFQSVSPLYFASLAVGNQLRTVLVFSLPVSQLLQLSF